MRLGGTLDGLDSQIGPPDGAVSVQDDHQYINVWAHSSPLIAERERYIELTFTMPLVQLFQTDLSYTFKQKLALKVHRLRRYKKAQQRKKDNAIFATNEKMFYRNLNKPHTDTISDEKIETPTIEHLENFWSGIWEQQVEHNNEAAWITEEDFKWRGIDEMEFKEFTESDITIITARLHNWKSPGIDKIHNFWYKKLTSLHKIIAKVFTDIVLGRQNIPEFIATGITYMLPKTKYTTQPSQYRPITCLPTIYKILTSAITIKINLHIEHHNIIAEEQKGCRRGHMGCKIKSGDYILNENDTISSMETTDLYKYLGYKQLKGIDNTAVKQTLNTEYRRRINAICKTQLSGKHLIKALNTFAIPILTYSFGVIKWSKTDIEQIERITRTTLTKHNNHHPKSAVERLTIKRQNGGRGLIDIHHLWQKQISRLRTFFHSKSRTSDIHKAITIMDLNYTLAVCNLSEKIDTQNTSITDPQKQKVENWKKKVLHGRHRHDLEQPHINTVASNKWLKIGNLFPESEGFIIAIQDQIINTKN
ncbi:jg17912 [Pararge aegeria aegeria]|uniref:Jg17912 protein n=1 Tax=Pararge aegeria aegeria TaxID=348720 RepID=A0A8S4R294_9NEOP|nr:jg17912 [Pararge aegeria aegeria]